MPSPATSDPSVSALEQAIAARQSLLDKCWTFDTKYYTADVMLANYNPDVVQERVEAVIYIFREGSELTGTFASTVSEVQEKYQPEIGILFQDCCSEKPASVTHDKKLDDLVSECMLEFIFEDLGQASQPSAKAVTSTLLGAD